MCRNHSACHSRSQLMRCCVCWLALDYLIYVPRALATDRGTTSLGHTFARMGMPDWVQDNRWVTGSVLAEPRGREGWPQLPSWVPPPNALSGDFRCPCPPLGSNSAGDVSPAYFKKATHTTSKDKQLALCGAFPLTNVLLDSTEHFGVNSLRRPKKTREDLGDRAVSQGRVPTLWPPGPTPPRRPPGARLPVLQPL